MAVIKGLAGDVKIGTTLLKVREWSADHSAEDINITNKQSGGYEEHITGIEVMEGSVTALWDNNINSSAPPYALVSPQSGVAFILQLGKKTDNDGGQYSFTGIISKMSIKSAFEGAIEYTFDFKSSGTIVYAATQA